MGGDARHLRALLINDSELHAAELRAELQKGGFAVESHCVSTMAQLRLALSKPWDVVLSDYALPEFSAQAAIALAKELGQDVPFIIVSSSVGEEKAVEVMRGGAQDFLLRSALARLVGVVERELREHGLRIEQRSIQEQLMVADRLAAMGTMAAGVAHEINNPLAAVIANLDLLLQETASLVTEVTEWKPADRSAHGRDAWRTWLTSRLERFEEPLRDARVAGTTARQIVRDIRVFSRTPDEQRVGAVSVERVLESAIRMAWSELKYRARVVKDFAAVRTVWANDARLGQVFLNLVLNAAQAVTPGRSEANQVTVRTRDEGERVIVEVEDTGVGIPPEILTRLFQPFLTTKPPGVGTGLGLAISRRILDALGGTIEARTVLGRGSVFKVTLPAADTEALVENAASTPRPFLLSTATRAHVLVIDDDALILRSIARIFASEHDVVTATSVRDALEAHQKGPKFDVILCDLMMPDLSGVDFFEELTKRSPDDAARVVFMTGGAVSSAMRDFLLGVPNAHVEKPFDVQNLRLLVHGLLAARPAAR